MDIEPGRVEAGKEVDIGPDKAGVDKALDIGPAEESEASGIEAAQAVGRSKWWYQTVLLAAKPG